MNNKNIREQDIIDFAGITSTKEQIEWLKKRNLSLNKNEDYYEYILSNLNFQNLIFNYSYPFIENNTNKAYDNTSVEMIVDFYFFDYMLTNSLMEIMGGIELKFTSNLCHEIDIIYPDSATQLQKLWDNPKQQTQLIANLEKDISNGYYNFKIFLDHKFYPAWLFIFRTTFGEKIHIFNKLLEITKFTKLRTNLNLSYLNSSDLSYLFNNVIRPFRNVSAHFSRLYKFEVLMDNRTNRIIKTIFNKIFTNDEGKFFEEYQQQVFERKVLKSFEIIILCVVILGLRRVKYSLQRILDFIDEFHNDISYFDISPYLTAEDCYLWPKNWKDILLFLFDSKNDLI